MSRKAKLAATALIYREELKGLDLTKAQLLGVSRKDDHNDFGLPGGKVEDGESLYEGMVREVKEETGLDVLEAIPFFFREHKEKVAVVYLVTKYSGIIQTEEKGKVDWITFGELKNGSFGDYNLNLEKYIINLNSLLNA